MNPDESDALAEAVHILDDAGFAIDDVSIEYEAEVGIASAINAMVTGDPDEQVFFALRLKPPSGYTRDAATVGDESDTETDSENTEVHINPIEDTE